MRLPRLRAAEFVRVHRTLTMVVTLLVLAGSGGGALKALRSSATPTPTYRPPTAQLGGSGLAVSSDTPTPTAAPPTASDTATSAATDPGGPAPAGGRTATPRVVQTPTPWPTRPPEMARCQDSDFVVHLVAEKSSYSLSQDKHMNFDFTMTYMGKVECNGYDGSGPMTLYVSNSLGQVVSGDPCYDACIFYGPHDPLTPGQVVIRDKEWWDGKQCTGKCWGCINNCPPQPYEPPGTYTALLKQTVYGQSNQVTFQLTP